ncbi:MAG: hypothetical protein DLM67_00535 [Candidatus Nephthysia bennettiae]|uniref:Uncharacterized protein n=1 Tax=Candidatus Nephthysia bennettiae TaxID=3127016 RepID=A0A934NBS6_9BACT|nr:hypothetical protein [Candidatus Dormibacteraeota bacterium]MBJ7612756.1 hypothetical protein [Candidatus Dormibacteraeota bacterium]PZS00810.1 MAG: hypothetical protein DLM67_00535 [Candidatus Dormibacteraeota bacterium]
MTTQQSNPQSHPWSAVVQARLVRAKGIDVVEEIEYGSGGQFTHREHIVNGPTTGPVDVLDEQRRRQLLSELESELPDPPSGVDAQALKVFTELLEESLGSRT